MIVSAKQSLGRARLWFFDEREKKYGNHFLSSSFSSNFPFVSMEFSNPDGMLDGDLTIDVNEKVSSPIVYIKNRLFCYRNSRNISSFFDALEKELSKKGKQ